MAVQPSPSPREDLPPFRVGICWGAGLSPFGSAGDALAGLVGGLLAADPRPEVTLLLPPDRASPLRWRERLGPGVRLIAAAPDQAEGARDLPDRVAHALACAWSRAVQALKRQAALELRSELDHWRTCRRNGAFVVLVLHLPGVLLLLTGLAACAWAASVLGQLVFGFLLPTLRFPVRLLASALRTGPVPLAHRVAAAGCDVWLVPPSETSGPATVPCAVAILTGDDRLSFEAYPTARCPGYEGVVAARAVHAPFQGPLGLTPAAEVRVFALDRPGGDGPATDLPALQRKYRVGPRFLFYPGALTDPTAHGALVRALGLLRRAGEPEIELACCQPGPAPPWLASLVEALGLGECLHCLGDVPAEDLRGLFRNAQAVPVLSGGAGHGDPVLDGLRHGCPITCADLPAFRQALEVVAEGVLVFDPTEPASVAAALRRTLVQRRRFRDRQREVYRSLARPGWEALAGDVLAFLEATCRTPAQGESGRPGFPQRDSHAA